MWVNRTPVHCSWEHDCCSRCRKGWQFLKIIHKIATYLNSTPINTPHKMKKCPSKTCTQMFTVTLFIRLKDRNNTDVHQ